MTEGKEGFELNLNYLRINLDRLHGCAWIAQDDDWGMILRSASCGKVNR
jgi:hypothetical protein